MKRYSRFESINIHVLDFDASIESSISLSKENVYCCLICGKLLCGKTEGTEAYIHSLDVIENDTTGNNHKTNIPIQHNLFLNMQDGLIWELPEQKLVEDPSMDNIKKCLIYEYIEGAADDKSNMIKIADNGLQFRVGLVGLNAITGYTNFNPVIQILCRINPLRNMLLQTPRKPEHKISARDRLKFSLSSILQKIYNPYNFKGLVTPHVFVNECGSLSHGQFGVNQINFPKDIFLWILSNLKRSLKRELDSDSNFIDRLFGIGIESLTTYEDDDVCEKKRKHIAQFDAMILTCKVPEEPVLQEGDEKVIAQVSILELLERYNGLTEEKVNKNHRRRMRIKKWPEYLIIAFDRQLNLDTNSKNNKENGNNSTTITYPVKSLNIPTLTSFSTPGENDSEHSLSCVDQKLGGSPNYNLKANLVYENNWEVHVLDDRDNQWFKCRDTYLEEVTAKKISNTATSLQVWERER